MIIRCILFLLCLGTSHAADRTPDEAQALFLSWVAQSPVPGNYTTAGQRQATTVQAGDLNSLPIFSEESKMSGNQWPHSTPNKHFDDNPQRLEETKQAIARNVRRGMSRLQDTIAARLEQCRHSAVSCHLSHILTLGRRALLSFEAYWKQVQWTFEYGPRQVEWHNEWKEYGPETNFWLKFRPTLTCAETYRLGPEMGGAKTWCNARALHPRMVLSAGSGDDFLYEHLVAQQWPGVTLVTTDCYQFNQPSDVLPFYADKTNKTDKTDHEGAPSSFVVLPVCLSGSDETTRQEYIQLVPPGLRAKFVSFSTMLGRMKKLKQSSTSIDQDYFDLIKCNIEASEYPMFADAFRHPDKNFKGTKQINMEMHRMGMHGNGLNFNSLVFMELLFSHFYSGGFHPVFTEKWHDQNAAQDVVWVNQTFWMESEMGLLDNVWETSEKASHFYNQQTKSSASQKESPNSGRELLQAHLKDLDPFLSPIPGILPNRAKQKKKKKFVPPPPTQFKGPGKKQSSATSATDANHDLLMSFYAQHNPKKATAAFVAKTLLKYRGREEVLFAKLQKKYMKPMGKPLGNPHAKRDPELTDDIVARLHQQAYDTLAFVMLVPLGCHTDKQCNAFPTFWLQACAMFPKYVYIAHCSAVTGQGHCGPEVTGPRINEWDGAEWVPYAGEKSFEAVLMYMREVIDEEPDMSAFQQPQQHHHNAHNAHNRPDRQGEMAEQVKQMESLFDTPDDGEEDEYEEEYEEDEYEDGDHYDNEGEEEDYNDYEYSEDNDDSNDDSDTSGDVSGASQRERGEWRDIPVEMVNDLSHEEFVARYVQPQLPVVLRRPIDRKMRNKNMLKWMKHNCDLTGEHATIHVFESDPTSVGWAGFNFDDKQEVSLKPFLKQLWSEHQQLKKGKQPPPTESTTSKQYGFDYRITCNCPKLLDLVAQLRYFQGDILQTDPSLPRVHWPVLIAGASGSKSSLHVDSHFLPFYLTVMSGIKHFRIIALHDWRDTLTPDLFDQGGVVVKPIDAYDDDVVEQELLSRGAHVYHVTLQVGDTIYIPTGALHGAINLDADDISLSYSSNFLDHEHAAQIKQDWCQRRPPDQTSAICHKLMGSNLSKKGAMFKHVTQKLKRFSKKASSSSTVSLTNRANQYSYWPWVLSHAGYCKKNAIDTCPGTVERCEQYHREL